MKDDPFGDLREWGRILSQLDELSRTNGLDQVQTGLVRLIHFRNNWQLREKALTCAREVRQPTGELISALVDLVAHKDVYVDLRIMAVNTVSTLLAKKTGIPEGLGNEALEVLGRQLLEPVVPVLELALERAINKITQGRMSELPAPQTKALAAVD